MAKSTLDAETLGKIMDDFIRSNEIQMLITLPEGEIDAEVESNLKGISSAVQFYILLQALVSVCNSMREEIEIDEEKWPDCLEGILGLVRGDLLSPGQ